MDDIYRIVCISNDLPIALTKEDYEQTFTKQEIERLESDDHNHEILWIDEDEMDHIVRLVIN